MCVCVPAIPGSCTNLCLFWQGRESLDAQSKPLTLLTVWDWSVQFEPKAQTLLRNPLYVEKPKLDKGQRKGSRFKVRCAVLTPSHPHLHQLLHPVYVRTKATLWLSLLVCYLFIWHAVGICSAPYFSQSTYALMRPVTEAAVITVVLHGIIPLALFQCLRETRGALIRKFIELIARLFLCF